MTDFIETQGNALIAFADGPGKEAANKLEQAFALAGESIEQALGKAAQTGQLDFENMVASIVKDLAQLAAQSALGGGATAPSQTVNLNMNLGQGANTQSVLDARGAITAGLTQAVRAGSRFI